MTFGAISSTKHILIKHHINLSWNNKKVSYFDPNIAGVCSHLIVLL